ncbi:DTW domain-containing protein [Vibrio sp. ZSDE26]|uniref:tRNA-uridine aminocarboxypropyltransferase n=1 Tax=Vibrio amylolyticus TaxID=2847292 RepID=A0A9X2BIF6_9VIBR|nr:tRNA-uridine aminocarboxypropyltransferase [Vibrio amylolyticus]MCK6264966.1 DTW domain-containing protein [Vibrio amylolyticus]
MRIHAFHHLYKHRQSLSTRVFNARGAKISRCEYCQVATKHCLCGYQPDIETNLAAMLIVSENEVFKPSNTGRLIADVVKETSVYQWNRTEPEEAMLAKLTDTNYYPIIVFPEDYVDDKTRLISERVEESSQLTTLLGGKTPLLVFIDGSWREARKIFRRSEYLNSLPVFSIKPESVSQYLMRKSDNEDHLSTAEVASLVLAKMDEPKAAKTLEMWFETFRESYLLTKTRLKPDLTKPALKRFLARENFEK